MKSKINLGEADSYYATIDLLNLLEDLQLDAAEELNVEIKSEWACASCEEHADMCSCDHDDDCSRRYDEYDDGASYED